MNGIGPYKYEDDGEPVPYPTYRCKATMQKAGEPGKTHLCRRVIDHEENEHKCICTIKWEPAAGS